MRSTALGIGLVGLAACAVRSPAQPPVGSEPTRSVYVVSNGWHTGIVLARDAISSAAWPEPEEFGASRYLEVGWGDRAAYLAQRVTTRLALAAAFGSSSTVLHITGFDTFPDDRHPGLDVAHLRLSLSELSALTEFIRASYARDPVGKAIWLARGYTEHSAFYVATGRYHLFNTCNTWTARALRSAGCPIAPPLALTASQLMDQAVTSCRIVPPAM